MMKINWIGYYYQNDGYGRFSSRMVDALQKSGVLVKPATLEHHHMPAWMQRQEGLDFDNLTISCMPPDLLQTVVGHHWLFTMTEGSRIPDIWVDKINGSGLERVLVPCQHNKLAFESSGVTVPISVIPGGTDPDEFPILQRAYEPADPCVFLTLADRGERKGWLEVLDAFYLAFGGKTHGIKDVRLIIKARKQKEGSTLSKMATAEGKDERLIYQLEDALDPYTVYSQADCVVLPSRSEGWGMPHREAACMGITVVTQQYSGLDDGHTMNWSMPLTKGRIQAIPKDQAKQLGEWMVADKEEIANMMKSVYLYRREYRGSALNAARWIRQHQTWMHSATALMELMEGMYGGNVECSTLSLAL